MIDQHRYSIDSWSPPSPETRIYLFYTVNIDAADEQTTKEAKAPAAMVLTTFSRNTFWFQHEKL